MVENISDTHFSATEKFATSKIPINVIYLVFFFFLQYSVSYDILPDYYLVVLCFVLL